jgi:hypothetical protein
MFPFGAMRNAAGTYGTPPKAGQLALHVERDRIRQAAALHELLYQRRRIVAWPRRST